MSSPADKNTPLSFSHSLLQSAFDADELATIFTDSSGAVVEANEAACKLFGWPKQQLLTLFKQDIVAGGREDNALLAQLVFNDNETNVFSFVHQNGTAFKATIRNRPVTAQQGQQLILSTIKAAKLLPVFGLPDDQYQHLTSYINYVTEALFVHDFEGRIIDLNQAACRSLGYSRQELLNMTIIDIDVDFDIVKAQALWSKVQPGQSIAILGHHRRKDRTIFPVEANLGIITIGQNKYYLGLVRDITARVAVEVALRESEDHYRSLVTNLTIGLVKQGPDKKVIYCNSAALEMLGLTEDELVGKTSLDPDWHVIHEDGSPFPTSSHPAFIAIETLKPVNNVIMGVHRPGKNNLVWLLINSDPSLKADGKLDHVINTFSNITPFIEARNELNKTQRNLKALNKELLITRQFLEETNHVAMVGGWEFDVPANKISWTTVTHLIHETDPEKHVPGLATGIQFYKEGESRDTITRLINEAIETGNEWDVELQIITAKGNEKWVRAKGKVELMKGTCVRLFGTFQDIDAQKKQAEILMQSEEQFRSAFENPMIGMALVNLDLTMIRVNQALCNMTGYNKEEFTTVTLRSITHPDHKDLSAAMIEELKNDSSKTFQYEKRYIHKNGNSIWARVNVAAVTDNQGNILYNLAHIQDITQIKEKENEVQLLHQSVQDANKMLAMQNEELEQFASIAAHDLQEPLRMISSFIKLIDAKYNHLFDDAGKKYFSFVTDGAARMQQIIQDLLDYSSEGVREEHKMNVDINILLQEIVGLNFTAAIAENAVIEWSDDMPVIFADKTSMQQLFTNLVSNGLKYQRPGNKPVISITAKRLERKWQFAITDNGIGIDKANYEKVFAIFKRLHTKGEYAGTGIGMAICKKIVTNYKGDIWIESELGRGTTFYFTLAI